MVYGWFCCVVVVVAVVVALWCYRSQEGRKRRGNGAGTEPEQRGDGTEKELEMTDLRLVLV